MQERRLRLLNPDKNYQEPGLMSMCAQVCVLDSLFDYVPSHASR
jgi:hypothetical protein